MVELEHQMVLNIMIVVVPTSVVDDSLNMVIDDGDDGDEDSNDQDNLVVEVDHLE